MTKPDPTFSRETLWIFRCEHGKACNFIADCPKCAKAEIDRLRQREEAIVKATIERCAEVCNKLAEQAMNHIDDDTTDEERALARDVCHTCREVVSELSVKEILESIK